MGAYAPKFAALWTPIYEGPLLKSHKISGAQNQECLPALQSGPTEALTQRR